MVEIRRAIRKASWRLLADHFLRTLCVLVFAALVGVLLGRVAQRLFGVEMPWNQVLMIAPGVCVGLSLLWVVLRRRRELAVARELDERAGLKESLSTALCVERSAATDPWANVVVETATAKAKSVNVGQAIPVKLPKAWPWPAAAAVALVVGWYLIPPWDILGLFAKKEAEAKRQQEIIIAKAEVSAAEKKLEELLKKANVEVKEDKGGEAGDQKADEKNAEEIRRAAVKKMTDVADKLKEMKDGEKGQKLDALRQQMAQLKQPGPGPMDEFAKQLAKGDFGKAEQALAELSKQMQDGSSSPEAKAQAQAQMENMAKQMQKLAQEKQGLAQQLAKAGMDPKKAAEVAKKMNAEEMKKAIEEMKNLTPEQKKQMQEAAKSMCEAGKQCEGMGKSMQQAAQAMSKEGMGEGGKEAMQGMSEQLSQMEQLQAEMQSVEQAMSECKGQLAKMCEGMGQCEGGDNSFLAWRDSPGQWKAGEAEKFGAGSGGPGKGLGAGPEENAADYKLDKVKANVQTRKGQIIGSRLVQGEQIRGESVAEFADAVESGSKEATEAIEENQVPREFQNAVKHYFGRLEAQAKDKAATPAPATPAEKK